MHTHFGRLTPSTFVGSRRPFFRHTPAKCTHTFLGTLRPFLKCTHKMHTHFFKCTQLLVPTAPPPITRLGGGRMPITVPRGCSPRGGAPDRTTGFSRTGTDTGATLMHRRWRLRSLFWSSQISRGCGCGGPLLRQTILQAHIIIRGPHLRISKILRIQGGGKPQ